jgi:Protein of unknown function (DUF2442)
MATITEETLKEAESRMHERMAISPCAASAHYDHQSGRIVVTLTTQLELSFHPSLIQGLCKAKPEDLSVIEVSPSGLGLHFATIDEDIYLPALLEGALGSPAWMAGLMGKKGGSTKSEAKASASRENGKLGGRPKKVIA